MNKGKFISIAEAMKQGAGKVAVRGWVYRERGSNKLKFIVLRDSSEIIQIVFERDKTIREIELKLIKSYDLLFFSFSSIFS